MSGQTVGRPKVVSACVNFASSTDNGTCFPTGTGTSDLCYGNITGCFSLIMFSPYWTTVCDSSSVFFRHKETNDLYYYLKTVTSNFYVHVRTVFSLSLFASHANLQIVYGGVSSQSPNPNGITHYNTATNRLVRQICRSFPFRQQSVNFKDTSFDFLSNLYVRYVDK